MSTTIIYILIVIGSFLGMEAVAWFTHKYIMHGLLWKLHKDHHKKESSGFFEHNDFFFLIFALPGIAGLFFGMQQGYNFLFWIGLGITLYGAAYFLVHEQARESAVPARNQDKEQEANDASQQNELFQRVVGQQGLGTQVQSEARSDPKQKERNGRA
jgi:hypothetical protein